MTMAYQMNAKSEFLKHVLFMIMIEQSELYSDHIITTLQ